MRTFSCANGNGVSYPHTRSTGASSRRKHSSCTAAATSAPKPPVIGASWLTMHRPVLLTLANTVSRSYGKMVRRSMTSHDTFSCSCAMSAARSSTRICAPYPTRDTSVPSRTTSAALSEKPPHAAFSAIRAA